VLDLEDDLLVAGAGAGHGRDSGWMRGGLVGNELAGEWLCTSSVWLGLAHVDAWLLDLNSFIR
jgi:hypothetical protein